MFTYEIGPWALFHLRAFLIRKRYCQIVCLAKMSRIPVIVCTCDMFFWLVTSLWYELLLLFCPKQLYEIEFTRLAKHSRICTCELLPEFWQSNHCFINWVLLYVCFGGNVYRKSSLLRLTMTIHMYMYSSFYFIWARITRGKPCCSFLWCFMSFQHKLQRVSLAAHSFSCFMSFQHKLQWVSLAAHSFSCFM